MKEQIYMKTMEEVICANVVWESLNTLEHIIDYMGLWEIVKKEYISNLYDFNTRWKYHIKK